MHVKGYFLVFPVIFIYICFIYSFTYLCNISLYMFSLMRVSIVQRIVLQPTCSSVSVFWGFNALLWIFKYHHVIVIETNNICIGGL